MEEPPEYLTIDELIDLIDEPNKSALGNAVAPVVMWHMTNNITKALG